MSRTSTKILVESKFPAEVEVGLIDEPAGWSPYLPAEDASKLGAVRGLLREGKAAEAHKFGRIFELRPIPA